MPNVIDFQARNLQPDQQIHRMLNPAWATANDPTAFNVSKFKVGKHYLPSQAALLEPLRYGTFFYTAFIEDINGEEKKQLLLRIPLRPAAIVVCRGTCCFLTTFQILMMLSNFHGLPIFLSLMGPAPTGATKSNFYLPLRSSNAWPLV